MKTTNSKFSVLALLLLLCVLLTSCDFFNVMQQSTSTDRTTTDRSDGEEPSPDEEDLTLPGKLTLAKNGKTDYTLIFPLGAAAWKRDLVLSHPWDSPGNNSGVGCHFLLQCMKVKSESEVAQSCPTLRDQIGRAHV